MSIAPAVRRRSPTRRWLRRVVIIAAFGVLAIGSFLGWHLYRRHLDDLRLQEMIAELDAKDPRWRLEDLEADRSVVPDAENSARLIRSVAARITPWPPGMAELIEAAEPSSPVTALSEEQLQTVIDAFESVESAIAPVLSLEYFPRGRHPITYSADAISTLLRHTDDMTQVYYRVLRPLLLLHLHEGDAPAAARDCICIANLGRSIGDELVAISQMVRQRYVGVAARGVERMLGQLVASDVDLARVQAALAEEVAYDAWPIMLRGERGLDHRAFVALGNGTLTTSAVRRGLSMNPPLRSVRGQILDWFDDRHPPQLLVAHRWVLDELTRMLEQTASLPWHERTAVVTTICAENQNAPELARIGFGMDKVLARFLRYHAYIRCVLVAVAAERHRLRHGAWPATAGELVPAFLAAIPPDPFDGQPLRYKRLPDGIVIYSVGADVADNGGNITPDVWGQRPATDVGVRLWDVAHRRQPPPPDENKHP